MKNKEKFDKEIIDIACKGYAFSVTKSGEITFCDSFKCDMCKFYVPTGDKSCGIRRYEWAESENVEKPTITSREKNFLDVLLSNCKYIARDKDNLLYVYYDKPIRGNKFWISDYASHDIPKDMYGDVFSFIKWEDEEPWSIEGLKKLEVKDE
jgi:hypothetical protein